MKDESLPKFLGIIGNPLGHSLSPKIHNKWIDKYHLNYKYIAFPMKSLDGLIQKIKEHQIDGLNVTLPFKQSVIRYLDDIDPIAKEITSVNTIQIHDHKLIGFNTDIFGIEKSIGETLNMAKSVLILGAGGAAQSIAYLANKKQINADIYNRTYSKAEHLANRYSLNTTNLDDMFIKDYDVIINASSVGLNKNESPIDLSKFHHVPKYVFDMIYNPKESLLLRTANKLKIPNQNGMRMLINQAKESFRIWTGIFPE